MNLYLCGQKAFGAALLERLLARGETVLGVSSPPWSESRPELRDRLRVVSDRAGLPWMPSGTLRSDTLPDGVDLILAAHSHDYIGRRTRLRATLGAIGYHPSLLPLHRGRDAVRWTIAMRDRVAGGSIYWLSDNVDAGDLAAQDHCLVYPDDTPETLWRRDLFPMGLRLFEAVLDDLHRGTLVRISQDRRLATWEPSYERPPLYRPELTMIGAGGLDGYTVVRERPH